MTTSTIILRNGSRTLKHEPTKLGVGSLKFYNGYEEYWRLKSISQEYPRLISFLCEPGLLEQLCELKKEIGCKLLT